MWKRSLISMANCLPMAPDPLWYTTHFLDGLLHPVWVQVAIQKLHDLETTFDFSLFHEELADITAQSHPVISNVKHILYLYLLVLGT